MATIVDSNAPLTVTFVTLKRGDPSPPGEVVEDITRAGVDGRAARRTGTRGGGFMLTGQRDLLNAAGRVDFLNDCLALQGKVVTVTDDFGSVWTNIVVDMVRPQRSQPILSAVGGIHAGAGTIFAVVDFECVDSRESR